MRALFAPAVALLGRVGYTKKFAIMGALALLAIAVLLANLYQGLHRVIDSSKQELAGLEVIKPIVRTVRHLQVHRGLSAGIQSGNREMQGPRASKEKEVDQALKEASAKLEPQVAAGNAWKKIMESWADLQSNGLELIPRENFLAHTRLIEDLLSFQSLVADQYALTNDPDTDSTYLIDTLLEKSPLAIERMGQLRALGTGVLTKRQPLALSQQIELTVLLTGLNSAVDGLRRNLEKISRSNLSQQPALAATIRDMGTAAEKVTALVNQDILSGAYATRPADYFALTTDSLESGYRAVFESLFPTLEELLERRIASAQRDLYASIAISALALLIYGYVSIGLYYATIGSIEHLADKARTIATGDLGVRVDLGTRDELTRVADSLNDLVAGFRGLIHNVHQSAVEVLDATKKLSGSTGHITHSSGQQSDAATSMAAAVEELTVSIEHLAATAQDTERISSRAGELSADGRRVVGSVVSEIQRIAEAVNQSASIVTDLGGRSEKISAIVSVIKEIADQTNLLALNAAIEAARAGESGRGFAVVADEVRKLSERTSRSTQEISKMIAAIQNGTREAVQSMSVGVARVSEGVALATQAGRSIDEIGGSARDVIARVQEISSSLSEQSSASTEIARNVERVARMAEENSEAVAENAATAAQLERLSERLETEVRRFRLG
jgi:methyl-accepting chemotaxis protein